MTIIPNPGSGFRTGLIHLLLLFCMGAGAQSTRVQARVDRDRILIGERIQLELEAEIPESAPIRFFETDSIPHFEILEVTTADTQDISGGTRIRQSWTLTSFDSGSWVIPAFSLGEGVLTDSIPIEVSFSPFDTSAPYHDVRDVLDEEVKAALPDLKWIWIGAGIGFLLLLLVIFLVWRRLRRKKPGVLPPVNILEQCLQALNKASTAGLNDKAYYLEVTDVFRRFLEERMGIEAREKTSEQLGAVLRNRSLPPDLLERWKTQWREADLVKFAKKESNATERAAFLKTIQELLKQLDTQVEKKEAHV